MALARIRKILAGIMLVGSAFAFANGPHGRAYPDHPVARAYSNEDLGALYGGEAEGVFARNRRTDGVYFTLRTPREYREVLAVGQVRGTSMTHLPGALVCNVPSGSTLKFIGFSNDGKASLLQVYSKGLHFFGNNCRSGEAFFVATSSLPKNAFEDFNRNNQAKADYHERRFISRVTASPGWELGGLVRSLPFQSYGSPPKPKKQPAQGWSGEDMQALYGREINAIYERNRGTQPVYFSIAADQTYQEVMPFGTENRSSLMPYQTGYTCNIYPGTSMQFIGFSNDGKGAVVEVHRSGLRFGGSPCPNGDIAVIPTRALPKDAFDQFNKSNNG